MTTFTHEPPDSPSQPPNNDYPVTVNIDYVDKERDRLSVLLRIFFVIPITILVAVMGTGFWNGEYTETSGFDWVGQAGVGAGGVSLLFLPVLLMILFRQKYPRWWFDFNIEMLKFSTRVNAYWSLLADQYPSTDEEQSVHIEIEYPDATQLNRWLPLVKWILAIPHYIVLFVLAIVAVILIILGWFAILITGRLPRGIHDFLVGVTRWGIRVQAYSVLLTTDKYPPFSLE